MPSSYQLDDAPNVSPNEFDPYYRDAQGRAICHFTRQRMTIPAIHYWCSYCLNYRSVGNEGAKFFCQKCGKTINCRICGQPWTNPRVCRCPTVP